MKENLDEKKAKREQVKPPKSLRHGSEEQARFINIRKPPPRKGDKGNEQAKHLQHNLWIFFRSLKWDPGAKDANGISWIELLALAERKGVKIEETIKGKQHSKDFAQKKTSSNFSTI